MTANQDFENMCARETLSEIDVAQSAPPVEIVDDSPTLAGMVAEFAEAAGVSTRSTPGLPPAYEIRLRLRLITEEYFELLHSALYGPPKLLEDLQKDIVRIIDRGEVDVELPEFADAMADLDYLVEGTRQAFGIDGQPIAEAVHAANMAKLSGGVQRRGDGTILKPEGWSPPDIVGPLCAQGWRGGE